MVTPSSAIRTSTVGKNVWHIADDCAQPTRYLHDACANNMQTCQCSVSSPFVHALLWATQLQWNLQWHSKHVLSFISHFTLWNTTCLMLTAAVTESVLMPVFAHQRIGGNFRATNQCTADADLEITLVLMCPELWSIQSLTTKVTGHNMSHTPLLQLIMQWNTSIQAIQSTMIGALCLVIMSMCTCYPQRSPKVLGFLILSSCLAQNMTTHFETLTDWPPVGHDCCHSVCWLLEGFAAVVWCASLQPLSALVHQQLYTVCT